MLKKIAWITVVATLAELALACTVRADSIVLDCPLRASPCSIGSTTLISDGSTFTFDFTELSNDSDTGTGFIAILVPTGGAAPIFTGALSLEETQTFSRGHLGKVLGDDLTDYRFRKFKRAASQVGIDATSFTVYEYLVGHMTVGPRGGGAQFTATDLAPGSVVVGFLEQGDDTLQTPLSASITSAPTPLTNTPEPSSLLLLGAGVLALPLGLRRKFVAVA